MATPQDFVDRLGSLNCTSTSLPPKARERERERETGAGRRETLGTRLNYTLHVSVIDSVSVRVVDCPSTCR